MTQKLDGPFRGERIAHLANRLSRLVLRGPTPSGTVRVARRRRPTLDPHAHEFDFEHFAALARRGTPVASTLESR